MVEQQKNRCSFNYIKLVQQSLNRILGLRLAVDGIMGPQTRGAIKSFQQKQGLVADGIVGPKTEAALKAALGLMGTQPPGPQPSTQGTRPHAGQAIKLTPNYIRGVQKLLNRVLRMGLTEDGIMGPKTIHVIREFQRRSKLKDDGIIGPKTEAALINAAVIPTAVGSPTLGALRATRPHFCDGLKEKEVLDHFDKGSAELKPDLHFGKIKQIGNCVRDTQKKPSPGFERKFDQIRKIRVVGYASHEGTPTFNERLSKARASRVQSSLYVYLSFIEPGLQDIILWETEGRGAKEARGPGWEQKDRRVVIELIPFRAIEPKRYYTLPEAIARCRDVINTQPPKFWKDNYQKNRLDCIVGLFEKFKTAVADSYINYCGAQAGDVRKIIDTENIPRMLPQDFHKKVTRQLRNDFLNIDPYFYDSEVADFLRNIDENVWRTINRINFQKHNLANHNKKNPALEQMGEYISASQRLPNHVYHCYFKFPFPGGVDCGAPFIRPRRRRR